MANGSGRSMALSSCTLLVKNCWRWLIERRGRRRRGAGVVPHPLVYPRMGTRGRPQADAHRNPFEGQRRCSPQPGGDGHFPWGILACPTQCFLRPSPPAPLPGEDPLRPAFSMLLPQLAARPFPGLAVELGQKFLPKGLAAQAPTTPKGSQRLLLLFRPAARFHPRQKGFPAAGRIFRQPGSPKSRATPSHAGRGSRAAPCQSRLLQGSPANFASAARSLVRTGLRWT